VWVEKVMEKALIMGWDLKRVKDEVELMKEQFMNGIADSFQPHV
jgi:hypothetical protein